TQSKRFGDRWGDAAALEAALVQGVSRFRDPGRGQGLAGIRRYLVRWDGKIAIRSGTARIAIVPKWDDDVPLKDGLPPFPGAHARRQLRPDARVKRRLGFSTRAIHGDPEVRPDWAPVVTPLYQSSTFTNPVGSTAEVLYTRYGNNPNQTAIANRLAALEGAEAAIFVASGMGAIALSHLAVLRPGDHLLSSEWIYGGVHRLFAQEFGRLGIDVTFVNPMQARDWKRAMKKTTRAIFVETPTNPLLRVIDLEPVATLCKTE